MYNIGKTPLLRARNLEDKLGIKKIYLKLEGNNPFRSRYDRLAKTMVSYTLLHGYEAMIVDGNKAFLNSVTALAKESNLTFLALLKKGEKWKQKSFDENSIINLIEVKKKDISQTIENARLQRNAVSFIHEEIISQLSLISYEEIAVEAIKRYEDEIDTFFYYHENSVIKQAYENAFLKNYINKRNQAPQLYGASYEENNLKESNDISVDKKLVHEALMMLQKLENLKVEESDSVAFAGFIKAYREGKLKTGRHVIVLDTARTKLKIEQLENFTEISKKELLDYVDTYLDRYSDSKQETVEAIEQAIKKGFILIARSEKMIDGVAVIVHMGFQNFIPTYHLAYIGINPNSKGRGIGSELIKEAINLTNGNISLHVDLDNKNAKRLYRKMGFKHVYDRMIYHSED